MNALVFLSALTNQDSLIKFGDFLCELAKRQSQKLNTLCANNALSHNLNEYISQQNLHNVQLHELSLNAFRDAPAVSFLSKYPLMQLWQIEPERTLAWNGITAYANASMAFYQELFRNVKPDCVLLFSNHQTFRSLDVSLLDIFCKEHSIPFRVWFSTPIKFRGALYDDIYFNKNNLDKLYHSILARGLVDSERKRFASYQKNYLEFKEKSFYKIQETTIPSRNILKTLHRGSPELKLKGLKEFFRVQASKYLHTNKMDIPNSNILANTSYILFLLNKANNWLTNYSAPDWDDNGFLLACLRRALPENYVIVVKDHPMMSYPTESRNDIYQTTQRFPNIYYTIHTIPTEQLAINAKAIVSTCSTSGIESLFNYKKLITLGPQPMFLPRDNPPCTHINNPTLIASALSSAIEEKPEQDKIIAYFLAVLDTSLPRSEAAGDESFDGVKLHPTFFERAADMIKKEII